MKSVLIIEDDQIVGNVYRHRFLAECFHASLASDGEAGLRAVAEFKPDLLILDLMLPRINGVDVLRQIRAQPQTASLPVIVLTNAYLSSLIQEAWDAGANQCLIKASCTPKQLLEVVRKLLNPTPPPALQSPSPQPADSSAPGSSTDHLPSTADFRRAFLNRAPELVGQLRALLQTLFKAEDHQARLPALSELYRLVHSVTGNAAVTGIRPISRLCAALEALLKELYEKPKNINASSLRTIAQTLDFLATLFDRAQTLSTAEPTTPPRILVVDDDVISRRAVIYALEKASLKCTSVDNPHSALELLSHTPFDLVCLDVDMPGMNGFELCSRIRSFSTHAKTPVIFVTGLTNFESRAKSTLSGGSDLIAKPFLFMELAVKATTLILRSQTQPPPP
jgi:DNA-binding response OmpR family regulator